MVAVPAASTRRTTNARAQSAEAIERNLAGWRRFSDCFKASVPVSAPIHYYLQFSSLASIRPSQLLSMVSEQVGAPAGPSFADGRMRAFRSSQSGGSEVTTRIQSTDTESSVVPLARFVSSTRMVTAPLVPNGSE